MTPSIYLRTQPLSIIINKAELPMAYKIDISFTQPLCSNRQRALALMLHTARHALVVHGRHGSQNVHT
jgi:hypothetical protein